MTEKQRKKLDQFIETGKIERFINQRRIFDRNHFCSQISKLYNEKDGKKREI